jgi:hypothetical protein
MDDLFTVAVKAVPSDHPPVPDATACEAVCVMFARDSVGENAPKVLAEQSGTFSGCHP